MIPDISEVRKRRRAAGVSQAGLAGRAGVSQSALSKMEGGRTDPSYRTVKAVFDALEAMEARGSSPVSALMNRRVLKAQAGEPVRRAIQSIRENDVSQLPVFSGERPVGSVSEKTILDLLRRGMTLERVSEMRVGEIMGPAFPVVPAAAGTESVAAFLDDFPAVLVSGKRSGRIVGIVTKSDLLKAVSTK